MFSKPIIVALAACFMGSISAAKAAPIEYVFQGVGSGFLGADAYSGNFNVTITGDTSNVTGGPDFRNYSVGTFSAGSLSADFFGGIGIQDLQTTNFVGFYQVQPSNFVDQGIFDPAFGSYDLMSSYPTTSGTVSRSLDPYITTAGNLTFDSVTFIEFQATTPVATTPIPSTLPMFGAAVLGIGAFGFMKRRFRPNVVST